MEPDKSLKNCFEFYIETMRLMNQRRDENLPVNEGYIWEKDD